LAYEFHLSPSQVLSESPRMQMTMLRYLKWRSYEIAKARRAKG